VIFLPKIPYMHHTYTPYIYTIILKEKRKATQAVKTTPHMKLRKSKPLWYRVPADKKGTVREVQQSTRRRKEVTRDWSTSLKQERAAGTDIAELS
jgi:hypothetical protein